MVESFISDYEKIISFDNQCSEKVRTLENEHRETIENKNHRNKIVRIVLLIILLLIAISTGILIGKTILAHDVYGANTVCYITKTGHCYHAASCGSLWSSCIKTTVYKAKQSGLTSCSKCSVGKLDISKKEECVWGIILCLIVLVPAPIALLYFQQQKKLRVINQQHAAGIQEIKTNYGRVILDIIKKNGMPKLVEAPQEVMLQNGKITCDNEKYYRYVSYYGKCYHSNPYCSATHMRRVWAYDITNLYACGKCAQKIIIPEWYKRYVKLSRMQKQYESLSNN